MRHNIRHFDPGPYGKSPSPRPLSQLVREAEIARARQGVRFVASAWAALKDRFSGGGKPAARSTPEENTRLPA